jgi:hypothetical protein
MPLQTCKNCKEKQATPIMEDNHLIIKCWKCGTEEVVRVFSKAKKPVDYAKIYRHKKNKIKFSPNKLVENTKENL